MIWRLLAGLFSGTIGNAYAYISDIVPPESRPIYMSYVSACLSTCFVIGPLIGGSLASFGIRVPFYAATCVAIMGLIMAYLYVEEPEALLNPSKQRAVGGYESVESKEDYYQGSESNTTGESVEMSNHPTNKPPSSTTPSLTSPAKTSQASLSPWLNPVALLVGGAGSFLNSCAFSGIAVVVPLVLMEPSFGLSDPNNAISQEGTRKISLFLGYILGMFGLFQAICMIYVFPYAAKTFGLLTTGAIGATINGIAFWFIIYAKKEAHLVPIYLFMAIGNALIRPVLPAFMGTIAPKDRNAEYISLSSTFGNLGMMAAGGLTTIYSRSKDASILLAGGLSLLNALIIIIYLLLPASSVPVPKTPKTPPLKGSTEEELVKRSELERFFGYGEQLSEEDFFAQLTEELSVVLKERGYYRPMNTKKGQALIKEIILASVPALPDTFDARMEQIYSMMLKHNHHDWAKDMTGVIPSLAQYSQAQAGMPGL